MLYLVGGTSRAGKSTLANYMLRHHAVPWFSLDYLTSIFHHGMPELGITHDLDGKTRAPLLWPRISKTLDVISTQEPRYLIEGDVLIPEHVLELQQQKLAIRACWLGYAEADAETMFGNLRKIPSESNNWIAYQNDEYVRDLIQHGIRASRDTRDQCKKLDFCYFETSQLFDRTIAEAAEYLTSRTG